MSRHCELFWDRRIHLLQWRNIIKALEDVCIENGTVVFSHFQSRMPQELLQSECVSSTVYQILSCKGMTELVKRSALNTMTSIITSDWQAKCVFSELFSMLSAEKIVRCLTTPDSHILTKILRQCRTERNYLYLACFGVSKSDLSALRSISRFWIFLIVDARQPLFKRNWTMTQLRYSTKEQDAEGLFRSNESSLSL